MAGDHVPMEPLVYKYGGFVFPEDTKTTSARCTPVYDRAGRTVIYCVYQLTIRFILQNDKGTDDIVQAARKELERPAQPFIYDAGIGEFRINVTGKRDVVWGPKPKLISMVAFGAPNCWELTWEVEVAIPPIAYGSRGDGRPMEFNYTMAYEIDRSNYTKRTYSGYLRIPQTRPTPDNRELHDTADRYLEMILPKPIPDFRRQTIQRQLDESKCQLNFTVVDDEFPPNIPPPFCVDCHISHRVSTEPLALTKWGGQLDAEYEVVKGFKPQAMLDHFIRVFKDRTKEEDKKNTSTVVPTNLTMEEPNIYGRSIARFSLTYRYTRKATDLLAIPGLWQPAPDSDWKDWQATADATARGNQGLVFKSADDSIWDLGVDEGKKPTTPGHEKAPDERGNGLRKLVEKYPEP